MVKTQLFTDHLPTRLSLLQRASVEQQADAWDELLKYYDPFVKKVLLKWGVSGSDLDDLKQQVFMRIWKGLGNYKKLENGSRFRNWLSTLIRRTAITWYHSNKHKNIEIELDKTIFNELKTSQPEVDKKIEKEWQQYIVDLALNELKQVFSGHAFEVLALSLQGKSGDDIARQLNIRKESVYVLPNRVKVRLRDEIKRLRFTLEGNVKGD
ncbi:MAG: sigma-70 family RNA polymerase sigma factor [Lentisphaeraceae bacterium]|nr:sigma-70 family RNA polymerase sigma factor [Lentisphaeraceae bacterium]